MEGHARADLDVGALPARPLDAGVERGQRDVGVLGAEHHRQQAVADLAHQLGVLRSDRREVDRDPLLDRGDRQLEGLAGPVRQRQLDRLAVVLEALARQCLADDLDVLPGPLELLAEPLTVPPLGDLRAGRAETEDEPAAGEVVERGGRHRRHRRGPRGQLHDRRADLDRRRLTGQPAKDRYGVRAVRLGAEHRVVAEALGFLHDRELVLARQAEAPVSELHSELHLQSPIQRGRGR